MEISKDRNRQLDRGRQTERKKERRWKGRQEVSLNDKKWKVRKGEIDLRKKE